MGSCHTGEKRPENGDTWQAIDLPGICSISHVLTAIKNEKLMKAILDKKILVEQLPTINEMLSPELLGIPARHPLADYHRYGFRVALGSDVPGMTGGHIGKEYEKAKEYGLTPDDLIQITYNACAYGFASAEVKQKLVNRVRKYAVENGLQLPPMAIKDFPIARHEVGL
jgi:adenosine deaminase